MTLDTFRSALDLALRIRSPVLLISGGEPTEHPQLFEFLDELDRTKYMVAVLSNGSFALDREMYDRLAAAEINVQVTNDKRYYPRNFGLIRHMFDVSWISYEDHIRTLYPCRRVKESGLEPDRESPGCFNLRSVTRSHGFAQAMFMLGLKARVCSPSVNVDGSVRAGEMDTCHRIGCTRDTAQTIEKNLIEMRCDRCGLLKNLGPVYRLAIGETDGSRDENA